MEGGYCSGGGGDGVSVFVFVFTLRCSDASEGAESADRNR